MHNPNNHNKLLEQQRDKNLFLEELHKMDLEDLLPNNTPPLNYTDIILNKFITTDPDLILVKDKVRKLAPSNIPVLILGETGTGKEYIAQALHGSRDYKKFIAVNCGAIPENLLESEFFGHKKGSFTGAITDKRGLVEEANGGTLFLDEIGDTPTFLQAKLLRVLESGSFRKVGDISQEIKVNFRLVSATNYESLHINTSNFRTDLYYRIAGSTIKLKPLRERPFEDIVMIIKSFTSDTLLVEQLINKIKNHIFPGNVRELINIIKEFKVLKG